VELVEPAALVSQAAPEERAEQVRQALMELLEALAELVGQAELELRVQQVRTG
jgi:hypothetical protein